MPALADPIALLAGAVIGLVVLAQVPSWNEALGVALVIAGVAVHREAARPDSS